MNRSAPLTAATSAAPTSASEHGTGSTPTPVTSPGAVTGPAPVRAPVRGMTPSPYRPTGLLGLSLHLTRARFAAHEGESLLYLASVLAFVVCSALALTVAGGTWMFYNRWRHPYGILLDVYAENPNYQNLTMGYFELALVACALLVAPMFTLASAAAVLGARGRERRLAALRLLGMSSSAVTRMSLIDTLVQATVGTLIGVVIYLVTLPLWSNLSMLAMPLRAAEMLLPWYLIAAVCLAVVALGLASSWWGLRQVRISPLGVARRTTRPALRAWRILFFVGVLGIGFLVLSSLSFGSSSGFWVFLLIAGVMLVMIEGMNIAGPWLLQQMSKLIARSPRPSVIWAARRVQADPKTTWQRVVGIGLLSLIGGYVAVMPIQTSTSQQGAIPTLEAFSRATQWDVTKGVIITLGVGFVLTATSILITQASAVFERAEQTVAMHKMGAPLSYNTAVMWLETLGPLVLSVALGAGLGATMAYPGARRAQEAGVDGSSGPMVMGIVLGVGVCLAVAALIACQPLQRQVLNRARRPND